MVDVDTRTKSQNKLPLPPAHTTEEITRPRLTIGSNSAVDRSYTMSTPVGHLATVGEASDLKTFRTVNTTKILVAKTTRNPSHMMMKKKTTIHTKTPVCWKRRALPNYGASWP